MPIHPLFLHVPLDPEHVELISSVFERVSVELGPARREEAPIRRGGAYRRV